ncbi:MAG TPA: mercuric transporter MerT family protein [Gammaproteobacteria bacterium]
MNTVTKESGKRGLLATGGLLGAVLASSCCIGPLLLLSLGVSGAWIGNLTALAPYQPLFLLVTLGFLAAGFWTVYRKPKAACVEGSYCASPTSERVLKVALWVAALLALAAVGVNVLAPRLL